MRMDRWNIRLERVSLTCSLLGKYDRTSFAARVSLIGIEFNRDVDPNENPIDFFALLNVPECELHFPRSRNVACSSHLRESLAAQQSQAASPATAPTV